MCSLHLTHPSVHTWSSGQPTVQRPGSSCGLPVGAGIRTHNLGLPRVSSPTLYPLGQRLPLLPLNNTVKAQKRIKTVRIVHLPSVAQSELYETTRIVFVRKENKNNDIYSTICLLSVSLCCTILEIIQ